MVRRYMLVSGFLAGIITAVPLMALFLFGLPVPVVFQSKFDSPVLPLGQDDIWTQTFFFPDRPVTGIAFRPGTYGRRSQGTVMVWIGAESDFESDNRQFSGRRINVDIDDLEDSKPQMFYFPAVQYDSGTRGVLAFIGTDIPTSNAFTLWHHSQDLYPDGDFSLNGNQQQGDIFFKILSPVRGLDIFRMIKSRWLSGIQTPGIWQVLSVVLWAVSLAIGLYFLVVNQKRDVS